MMAAQSQTVLAAQRDAIMFQQAIGRFAQGCFEEHSLIGIAEKIFYSEDLTLEERSVILELELPFLGKLVEIFLSGRRKSAIARFRPAVYFHLAREIENSGGRQAGRDLLSLLRAIDPEHEIEVPIWITFDSWDIAGGAEALLEVFHVVMTQNDISGRFLIRGPSVSDLLQLSSSSFDSQALLPEFKSLGVGSIEADADHSLLLEATRENLETIIYRQLSQDCIGDSCSANVLSFDFSGKLDAKHDREVSLLGGQVVRLAAISRLLFHEQDYIQLPLSLVGDKVAHVAISFGVNDLGFVALNNETAAALGVWPLQDALNVLDQHSPLTKVYLG